MKKTVFTLILVCAVLFTSCVFAADDPFMGMLTYREGTYYCGRDMQPGEYVLITTSDYLGYFCVSSDILKNDITFNGNFQINSIITVERGDYVELKRCIAVSSSDFYKEYTIKKTNYGVMLKVGYGYDIEPGTYRLKSDPSSQFDAYYCIFDSSRQEDIVENDLFSGSCYVTVSSGQYLELSRCIIVD